METWFSDYFHRFSDNRPKSDWTEKFSFSARSVLAEYCQYYRAAKLESEIFYQRRRWYVRTHPLLGAASNYPLLDPMLKGQ